MALWAKVKQTAGEVYFDPQIGGSLFGCLGFAAICVIMPGFQCPWRRQRIPVQCFRSKAVKAVETKQIQLKQLQKQVQEKRVQQKQLWALISVCETHVMGWKCILPNQGCSGCGELLAPPKAGVTSEHVPATSKNSKPRTLVSSAPSFPPPRKVGNSPHLEVH
ncbi:Hypothetical predicted protein [Podarcis lilfordi]|uniref:Uncharacterized protein n=1 Tax=Podarcis lilfordi TaxID=74358 RepID=A0AA35KFG9_9SAUR|nr:Hypothetical predicted protein [Podarcis lilfordi]